MTKSHFLSTILSTFQQKLTLIYKNNFTNYVKCGKIISVKGGTLKS